MKKFCFLTVLLVTLAASVNAQPTFGAPTDLQRLINEILGKIPINIAGKSIRITFEGDYWRGQVNGKDTLAGLFKFDQDPNGDAIITISQSYVQVFSKWVKTPGPMLFLEYKKGPPVSIRTISKEAADEALIAITGQPSGPIGGESAPAESSSAQTKEPKEPKAPKVPVIAVINIAAIQGIPAPATGKIPATTITETKQYSGTITWSPAVSETFAADTRYAATITLTAKDGYTLQGTAENFFKVAKAVSVRNNANTGVVTAMFAPTQEQKIVYPEDRKLSSIGVSVGSSFIAPLAIGTVHGTFAPFRNTFIELGVDAGTWRSDRKKDVTYYSLYPFANFALFLPFPRLADGKRGGWYLGTGAGYMMANYQFDTAGSIRDTFIAVNIVTGFNLLNMFDISYTAQTDFKSLGGKLALGYVYRF